MVVAAPAPLTLGIYAGHFFFGKIREETYRRVGLILFLGLGMLYLLERRLKIPVLFPFHVDMTLRM
ncbi:MAG: hypothetical protein QG555_193 [Thermodesulfobacteriota bacterium]|nr:hypothetical protein [Thermodesulfobacteriota bacterium]